MNLNEVRRLSRQEGLTEIYHNGTSRVVSFVKYDGVDDELIIRINVYWTTGTVGTCLDHPRQGKTQLFRRNVDLTTLRQIFRDPRVHTGAGYHRRRSASSSPRAASSTGTTQDKKRRRVTTTTGANTNTFPPGSRAHVSGFANCTVRSWPLTSGSHKGRVKIEYDDRTTYHVRQSQLVPIPSAAHQSQYEPALDEEAEARKQLEVLEAEEKAIQQEKKQVQAVLKHFEDARRRKAEEERRRLQAEKAEIKRKLAEGELAAKERERDNRGRSIKCNLYCTTADFVNKNFDANVTCVACGGESTLIIYENGGTAWTSGLTTQLHNKLNGRQNSLPKPEYAALGSMDRYYIRFRDGKSEWVGCDDMTKELKSTSGVKTIAFGKDWDSYFIVYYGGGYCYKNVPSGLEELMKSRRFRTDIDCAALGPDGEYYLRVNNGKAWYGGMDGASIDNIASVKNRVKSIVFGDDDTYICRYT